MGDMADDIIDQDGEEWWLADNILYTVRGLAMHRTKKALLLEMAEGGAVRSHWFPFSQCPGAKDAALFEHVTIQAPHWLLEEKNLLDSDNVECEY